ncbi:regucalcin-like [Triplophysa dalaica]|uniref:regucalcin-like n=1 Tax=Triplophysa dalaica TaxID=1582913 RepID=UPI0024E007A0|nr:regucalcin-like [Triplophysa dalaica]
MAVSRLGGVHSRIPEDTPQERMNLARVPSGREESITTEKPVGSLVRKAGGYVIEGGMRFVFVQRVMHSITTAAQLDKEKPNACFSDGKVDKPGACPCTMGMELPPAVMERKQGSLYTLYPDRSSSLRPGGHLQHFGRVTGSPLLSPHPQPDKMSVLYLFFRVCVFVCACVRTCVCARARVCVRAVGL